MLTIHGSPNNVPYAVEWDNGPTEAEWQQAQSDEVMAKFNERWTRCQTDSEREALEREYDWFFGR